MRLRFIDFFFLESTNSFGGLSDTYVHIHTTTDIFTNELQGFHLIYLDDAICACINLLN